MSWICIRCGAPRADHHVGNILGLQHLETSIGSSGLWVALHLGKLGLDKAGLIAVTRIWLFSSRSSCRRPRQRTNCAVAEYIALPAGVRCADIDEMNNMPQIIAGHIRDSFSVHTLRPRTFTSSISRQCSVSPLIRGARRRARVVDEHVYSTMLASNLLK